MQRQVEAASGVCDLAEKVLVETGLHRIALLVLDEYRVSVGIARLQHGPIGGAHTQGEHADPILCQLLGDIDGPRLVVLTICDHDDGLGAGTVLAEGGTRLAECRGESGSLDWDQVGIEQAYTLSERLVVEGKRGLEEGVPGERNEPESVGPT